ncbi:glycosyl hydrolase 115 family protein [Hyphococcus luteus]|nr:glycosyl hydrolase 115 family protein [Marinicaulis flavus]
MLGRGGARSTGPRARAIRPRGRRARRLSRRFSNVGDLKPMEFPMDFFLDYAWNPGDWPLERLPDYPRQWAAEQFGEKHASEIANLLSTYTKYNARRKSELLDTKTYSLVNYNEAERIAADYNALAQKADALHQKLPDRYDDAYMQLVWRPIQAGANLNALYLAAAKIVFVLNRVACAPMTGRTRPKRFSRATPSWRASFMKTSPTGSGAARWTRPISAMPIGNSPIGTRCPGGAGERAQRPPVRRRPGPPASGFDARRRRA